MRPQNAAIWYAQDGFDPAAKGINGRRVAGESFLKGFLRHADVDEFVILSKMPEDVEPVRALAEIGIDISPHRSKHLDEFLTDEVETVITVCGNADQACPVFPGEMNRHHWPFDDPAHATGSEEEQMAVFRRVLDEIRRVFEAYAAGRRDERGR